MVHSAKRMGDRGAFYSSALTPRHQIVSVYQTESFGQTVLERGAESDIGFLLSVSGLGVRSFNAVIILPKR